MRQVLALSSMMLILAVTASPAAAQEEDYGAGRAGGVGLGIQAMLEGPAGASFVYDAGVWHLDVIAHLASNGDTDLGFGVRFFYALHSSDFSDFSVGGGLGVRSFDDDVTLFDIEGGAKIRAFIVSNVALSAFLGLAVVTGDDDRFRIGGQITGAAGLTYFFW